MQALTLEIGFSETTFVLPARVGTATRGSGSSTRGRRCPSRAIRRSARRSSSARRCSSGSIVLETGAGPVAVVLERDDSGRIVFGRMEQPLPEVRPVADTEALFAALDVTGSEVPVELYDNGATHILVALSGEDAVAALAPDSAAIASFGVTGVNCFAGAGSNWTTRMFWPGGEDAATGSAAGPIACHLCRHGPRAVGHRGRDLAGRRDRPPVDALRSRRGRGLRDRARGGRRQRGRRGSGRVPALGVSREEAGDRLGGDAGRLDGLRASRTVHDVRDGVRVARAGRVDLALDADCGNVLDGFGGDDPRPLRAEREDDLGHARDSAAARAARCRRASRLPRRSA